MKRILLVSLTAAALAACADSNPTAPDAALQEDVSAARAGGRSLLVTSSADDGPGSFRWAIEEANADPGIGTVRIRGGLEPIALLGTVRFTGSQPLQVAAANGVIDGAGAGGTAFEVTGGGDLTIEGLTVQNAPGEGIAVLVPSDAEGTIRVSLRNVTIADNRGHGFLVNDQDNPVAGDEQPDSSGSAAGLHIEVQNSRFVRNGFSVSDRDGIRINEGAEGSLTFLARGVLAEGNGADGIELDERGSGDVYIEVRNSRVLRNGSFDPEDQDDGFDIDEMDDGSIIGFLTHVDASDNFEEGLDFNENNAGDLRVDLTNVTANNNPEEGIDYEEDDDFAGGGDLVATMRNVTANGNGGDGGLKIREKGAGSLQVDVTRVEANDNTVSGIAIREDADGSLVACIRAARTRGNAAHGIDFDENSTGDLTASVYGTISTANGAFGVRADQQLPGVGTLLLQGTDLAGNAGGTITGNNVTVTGGT